jgi:hypothetical protein
MGGDRKLNVLDYRIWSFSSSILFVFTTTALGSCASESGAALGAGADVDGDADSDTGADGDVDADSDGDGDSEADTDVDSETDDPADASTSDSGDADTDDDTEDDWEDAGAFSCSGAVAGSHCWYLGEEQASCAETCAAHGGFDAATVTYAGSDGTDDHCALVLDALGASGSSVYPLIGIGAGIGCAGLSGARYRVFDEPTTAGATYVLARRACACAE